MYLNVHLQHLRGIRELAVQGLRRVNLFVGRNNSGKTTLLEGLFLLGGATNPAFPTILGRLRGHRLADGPPDAVWRPLFWNMDPHVPIDIQARWSEEVAPRALRIEALSVTSYADLVDSTIRDAGVASVTQEFVIGGLRLRYTSAGGKEETTEATYDSRKRRINVGSKDRQDFVRTTFLSARSYPSLAHDAQQYSFLVRIKQEQDVVDAVRIIEPRIERIEVLSEPGGPAVYVDLGLDSLIPLAACGEGFVRLFSIAVELTASRRGVLLVDEIDNGLHYSVMEKHWLLLGELCAKHDVQVVATTHNEEMIHSAFRAFPDRTDLGLYRIDRRGESHIAVQYDESDMEAVQREHFEVRG